MAFKIPGFQERQEAALRAKRTALQKLRSKPRINEDMVAERASRSQAREQALASKRLASARAKAEAVEAKREKKRKAEADALFAKQAAADAAVQAKFDATARKVAERKSWTEDDRKAARDERYAARKMRQGRR